MRRILVPLDGSPLAETAIPYARTLAAAGGWELILLSVWEVLPEEIETVGPDHARSLRDHGVRYFRAYLNNVAEALERDALEVSSEVRVGHPAIEIMLAASEFGADLVAMASHGRRGISQRRRGSVADKVLRGSTVPVLIIGPQGLDRWPQAPASIRSILVPLDGSAESETALPVAADIARATGARIALLRAVPSLLSRVDVGLPESYPPDIDLRLVKDAQAYLKSVRARYSDLVGDAAVERGFPAQVVLEAAERDLPDLIIMTSRSRFAGDRWALGSVADEVIEGPVPVLLVHPAAAA